MKDFSSLDFFQKFGHVIPASITPFDDNYKIDFDALSSHLLRLEESGISSVVLSGTTGESATLTYSEKEELLKFAKSNFPSLNIISGFTSNNTYQSIESAKISQALGCNALLLVVPYYLKPTQEGVCEHIYQIAASIDIPVIVYDIPSRSSIGLSHKTIYKIAEIDNVIAIKDAKGDFEQLADIAASKANIQYISGDDFNILSHAAFGANGVISVSANIAPKIFMEFYKYIENNDLSGARKIFFEALPLIKACMNYKPGAISAKFILSYLNILQCDNVRLPYIKLNKENAQDILKSLKSFDIKKWI